MHLSGSGNIWKYNNVATDLYWYTFSAVLQFLQFSFNSLSHLTVRTLEELFREGTFFIGGGGGRVGRGLGRGGSSARFLEKGEGQTFWSRSPGEGHRFFITMKNLLHVTSIKSTLYFIIKIQTLWKTETAFAYN